MRNNKMPEYDIKPIPTEYKGRRYRSRLEARWAAFFAMLEWPFEYEPYDLGEWSPDFLLKGSEVNVLVEVKPTEEYFECAKYFQAFIKHNFEGFILLLTSKGPWRFRDYDGDDNIGIGHYLYDCDIKFCETARLIEGCCMEIDLVMPPGIKTIFGKSDIVQQIDDSFGEGYFYVDFDNNNMCPMQCLDMWVKAANEVQYMKPKEARGRR